jgi:hypothetical protein
MYYKLICILYALLCGQNFILVKKWVLQYSTIIRREPQMVPFANTLGRYYCKRTWPRADSCPHFLDVQEHRLSAYLQGFG